MTDLPSSLGIEAVELLAEGAGAPRSVTVRATGRWRRRWPELRGQAMLVFDGPAGRQRFPATPEPPSLNGGGPPRGPGDVGKELLGPGRPGAGAPGPDFPPAGRGNGAAADRRRRPGARPRR